MSKLEDLLAYQLDCDGIGYDREFQFCEWRKFRADFRLARTGLGAVLVEVQGFSPSGHHGSGFSQAHSDAEKISLGSALGYRWVICTGKQVKNGSALAWIKVALGLKPLEALNIKNRPDRKR